MKTLSFNVENLCVPCHCACRHCLLSAGGGVNGVPYDRGEAFARKLHSWLRDNRPDLHMSFYVGCCNDFPELERYIRFLNQITPQLKILQFNGLQIRNESEIADLLEILKAYGMGIDLTFYGAGSSHDRFAGRKGDFAYLLSILETANRLDIPVQVSIAVTTENLDQMQHLMQILSQYKIQSFFAYLPHAKGRGEGLSEKRLTASDFERMPGDFAAFFGSIPRLTEAQWIERGVYPEPEGRHLTLALTADSIDRLEKMEPEQILRELETLDDSYYASLPAPPELARLVGRPDNQQVFRWRDMYLQWQKRYFKTHPLGTADMNDERNSFSVRIFNERI